jgi:dTDP-D-glucose 4,6-dehydratase
MVERGENALYEIDREIRQDHPGVEVRSLMIDINNLERIEAVFAGHRPEIVLHAAAYKHVPMVEMNPEEGWRNNTEATRSLAELSVRYGVRRFVLISTDKAVNPVSVMGKTKLAAVKVRVNQDIFRKMVLQNYGGKCCVTGLSVPDVLCASHISPWAEDEKNRLNPENGLCLSATYDAAFDRHLISFDEHYRLVVSKEIKDLYTDVAARSYFFDCEGQTMTLPAKFLPSQSLLEKHRELLAG